MTKKFGAGHAANKKNPLGTGLPEKTGLGAGADKKSKGKKLPPWLAKKSK